MIRILDTPPTDGTAINNFYIGNRPLLGPSPLIKLPPGAVQPQGWLRRQLELMVEGFTGHLAEISPYLKDESGWLTGKSKMWGDGHAWEEDDEV